MGLKGCRLWAMGQLESTITEPHRGRTGGGGGVFSDARRRHGGERRRAGHHGDCERGQGEVRDDAGAGHRDGAPRGVRHEVPHLVVAVHVALEG